MLYILHMPSLFLISKKVSINIKRRRQKRTAPAGIKMILFVDKQSFNTFILRILSTIWEVLVFK